MSSNDSASIFNAFWQKLLLSSATPRVLVALGAFLLIFAVTANHFTHPRERIMEAGRISSDDYVAPRQVEYVDSEATEQASDEAAAAVVQKFKPDETIKLAIIQNLDVFFQTLEQYSSQLAQASTEAEESTEADDTSAVTDGDAGTADETIRSRDEIESEAIGVLLDQLDRALNISTLLVDPVTAGQLRGLLYMDSTSRQAFQKVVNDAIIERIVRIIFETNIEDDLDTLRERVFEKANIAGLSRDDRILAATIASYFIQPTAVPDNEASAEARQEAREKTPEVTGEVREGEVFLRKGDRITRRHLDILDALGMLTERSERPIWPSIVLFGLILIAGFALGIIYTGTTKGSHLRDLRYYILLYLVFTIAYLAGFLLIRWSLNGEGGAGSASLLLSSLPVIAAAVLFSHYIGRIVSATMSGLLAILITLAAGNPIVLLPAILPSLAASLLVSFDCPKPQMIRTIVLLPVLWAGAVLAQAFSMELGLELIQANPYVLFAGIAPAPVALILANYLLDGAFNFPTANRLREFDNQDHPLLRKLQLEAPGTWHHSMMISLISEAACQTVGGNSVLVRVASMYHDIGKTRRPDFFIENQHGGVNVHDKYSPWLSKIIVESHVKDGISMARAHGLPEELTDLIPQHHGTSLITYFFRKALALSEDGSVNEYDYRYPGPKPQSLEGACINIADAFESSTRSLEEPTPHRIRALTERIFEDRLLDGQFDECGLSLSELQTIKETIIGRLIGAYHARIEYPEEEELRRQFQLKRAETEKSSQRVESAPDPEDE